MGGKKSEAPDYRGAAEAQGESSIANINAQTLANRPNQNTPWGSSQWQKGPGGQWTQDINLTDATQSALENEQAIQEGRSGIAKGMLGTAGAEMQTPEGFWDNLPSSGQSPDVVQEGMLGPAGQGPTQGQYSPESIQRGVEGAGYNPDFAQTQFDRQMSLAQPQMERQQQQLETQLRNQGLSPGTPAYDNAISDLRNNQGEQTSRMQQDAMRLGADEQQRQFGRNVTQGQFGNQASQQAMAQQLGLGGQRFQESLGAGSFAEQQRAARGAEAGQRFGQGAQQFNMQNQARQQQIAERLQREGWSLNKINAMMSGQQVASPQMPNFQGAGAAQATNYLGAAQSQGEFGLQQQQNAMAPWTALGQVAGGAASSMAPWSLPSDIRLKTNIKKVAKVGPLDLVSWTWNGLLGLTGSSAGFIAQQVQEFYPQFVERMDNGYLAIDYKGLVGAI